MQDAFFAWQEEAESSHFSQEASVLAYVFLRKAGGAVKIDRDSDGSSRIVFEASRADLARALDLLRNASRNLGPEALAIRQTYLVLSQLRSFAVSGGVPVRAELDWDGASVHLIEAAVRGPQPGLDHLQRFAMNPAFEFFVGNPTPVPQAAPFYASVALSMVAEMGGFSQDLEGADEKVVRAYLLKQMAMDKEISETSEVQNGLPGQGPSGGLLLVPRVSLAGDTKGGGGVAPPSPHDKFHEAVAAATVGVLVSPDHGHVDWIVDKVKTLDHDHSGANDKVKLDSVKVGGHTHEIEFTYKNSDGSLKVEIDKTDIGEPGTMVYDPVLNKLDVD